MLDLDTDEKDVDQKAAPKALVVDDESYVRELLSRVVAGEGIDCRQAASGKEALAVLREGGFEKLFELLGTLGRLPLDLIEDHARFDSNAIGDGPFGNANHTRTARKSGMPKRLSRRVDRRDADRFGDRRRSHYCGRILGGRNHGRRERTGFFHRSNSIKLLALFPGHDPKVATWGEPNLSAIFNATENLRDLASPVNSHQASITR